MSKQLNYSHVMSRMEWFRDLKLIFNKLLSEEDILKPVEKFSLIKELNSRASKLELLSPEDYSKKSKLQAFSLSEIFAHIDSLDSTINFDQLIDSLIYLSIDKKKKEKKPVQEPPDKTHKVVKSMDSDSFEYFNPIIPEPRVKTPILINLNPNLKPYQESFKIIQKKNLDSSPIFEANFPEHKFLKYPELSQFENLQFLYLAGNSLSSTLFTFPQSLVAINLSCNRISELKFEQEMKNLQMINLTNNQISRIFSVNQMKGLKELMVANNCLRSLNLLCHLPELSVVDCSFNEIDSFEDIAGLVISKRLGVLKIKGNSVCLKENFDKIVAGLLPRIYNWDPASVFEISAFKHLGNQAYVPLRQANEEIELRQQSDRFSVKSNKSEKTLQLKPKYPDPDLSPAGVPKSMKTYSNQSRTPIVASQTAKVSRSNSQIRIERNKVMTSTSKSTLKIEKVKSVANVDHNEIETYNRNIGQRTPIWNKNAKNTEINLENEDFEEITVKGEDFGYRDGFMDLAERRIKVFKDEGRPRHNISVISNESIQNVKKKSYGNPVAAMMIGPPAVVSGKGRTKTPACYSLDLTKGKKK